MDFSVQNLFKLIIILSILNCSNAFSESSDGTNCRLSTLSRTYADSEAQCGEIYAHWYVENLNKTFLSKAPWKIVRWGGAGVARSLRCKSVSRNKEYACGGSYYEGGVPEACENREPFTVNVQTSHFSNHMCFGGCEYNGASDGSIGVTYTPSGNICGQETGPIRDEGEDENLGDDGCLGGDPVNIATGNSIQIETDFKFGGGSPLGITRYYNSQAPQFKKGIFGSRWSSLFDQKLVVSADLLTVKAERAAGAIISFTSTDSQFYTPLTGNTQTITKESDGLWRLIADDNSIETYDAQGKLQSVNYLELGRLDFFYYPSGNIWYVQDRFANKLVFEDRGVPSNSNVFAKVIVNDSYEIDYNFINGRIKSVTIPDSTTPFVSYEYGDMQDAGVLVSKIDALGKIFATWTFDAEGRATSSIQANGADTTLFTYHDNGPVTVTNPLGKQSTYEFEAAPNKKYKVKSVKGQASTNCIASNTNYTYDSNGFVASKTDWNGNVTQYTHDNRGLETSRTEAFGTLEQRMITTEWHSTFRLPIKITEPGRYTELTYSDSGQVINKTVKITQPQL